MTDDNTIVDPTTPVEGTEPEVTEATPAMAEETPEVPEEETEEAA